MKLYYKIWLINEKEGFSVIMPNLPGCYNQGETKKEAIKNIKKAFKSLAKFYSYRIPWSICTKVPPKNTIILDILI